MSSDDVEVIRTKAEVSVHLVRNLVTSWLRPPTAAERKADEEAARKASGADTSLYATNREATRKNVSAMQRAIAGKKASSALEGVADGKGRTGTDAKSGATKKADSDSEEEGKGVKKTSSGVVGGGSGKKRPADVLSQYLDKSGGKKKKKKLKTSGWTVSEK
ncbi:hypothetical protein HDV00_005551 [Rhizophlyctis rosea]|nr:hypothetical protein HDV00_005551 [Rhizophlyctis rosea]